MNILITGHTGYIGQALTSYPGALNDFTLLGASRNRPSSSDPAIESCTCYCGGGNESDVEKFTEHKVG